MKLEMRSSIPDDKLHLVITPGNLGDDYNKHASVTLVSACMNCSRPIVAHIFYEPYSDVHLSSDELNKISINKSIYLSIVEEYGGECYFHEVRMPDSFKKIYAINNWTTSSLLRLFIPQVLNQNDRCIYLDCDVVVNMDLYGLYKSDLSNVGIAAVASRLNSDGFDKYRRFLNGSIGIDDTIYFNSGVLLFNLKKVRKDGLLPSKSISLLEIHPELPAPDQDVLNAIFRNDTLYLNPRYNVFANNYTLVDSFVKNNDNDIIIHYTGDSKPWKRITHPIDLMYWHYLRYTPFGDDYPKLYSQISAIYPGFDNYIDNNINLYTYLYIKKQGFCRYARRLSWYLFSQFKCSMGSKIYHFMSLMKNLVTQIFK